MVKSLGALDKMSEDEMKDKLAEHNRTLLLLATILTDVLSVLFALAQIAGESVLGSWVGARRLALPFLIPHRAPRGFTQDPSTDYYAASQRWSRAS